MIELKDYRPEDLFKLDLQDSQAYLKEFLTLDLAESLVNPGLSWSVWRGDEVLACSGFSEIWPERACLWAYVSRNIGRDFVAFHRLSRRIVDTQPFKRVEITVDCDFMEGHRWAAMLGFTLEAGRMRAYTPSGKDFSLYSRVA